VAITNSLSRLENVEGKMKRYLWRITVRMLRKMVDRADEWVHEEERKLREVGSLMSERNLDLSVDREESAAREKVIRKARVARPKQPRLVYQHGEFVRQS
jgi:hypothetical protein